MSIATQTAEKGAFELIEESVHLLRVTPLSTFALYYAGTLPFTLGLLYYWTDMTSSATAAAHHAEAALGVSILYVWMKFWQALFACEMKAQATGIRPRKWTASQLVQLAMAQTIIQASAIFILPMAALLAVPFGWAFAFYQNALAVSDVDTVDAGVVFNRAKQHALLWPWQNHYLLAILGGFTIVVFLNAASAIFVIPYAVKMFLGIETVFTQSIFVLFNTTFLAVAAMVTYLCVDPIIKTVYMLRCFYSESLQSGADLRAELRALAGAKSAVLLLLSVIFFCGAAPASAVEASGQNVSPEALQRSITEVISRREYAWRMPREKVVETQSDGVVKKFLRDAFATIAGWVKAIFRQLKRLVDWLLEKVGPPDPPPGQSTQWSMLRIATIVLTGILAAVLIVLLYRSWRSRRKRPVQLNAEPMALPANLHDENLLASQLPEDEWLALARDCLRQGNPRLALRAFYLASLAHLAQREMIAIAKFKSNREYQNELSRRARNQRDLVSAFSDNVTIFESVWYGRLETTEELLQLFKSNLSRMQVQA